MTRLHHFASCLICADFVFTIYSLCAHSKLQGKDKFSFSSSLWMTDVNLASSSELKWFFQSPATPNINKQTRTLWWTQQIIDVKILNGTSLSFSLLLSLILVLCTRSLGYGVMVLAWWLCTPPFVSHTHTPIFTYWWLTFVFSL